MFFFVKLSVAVILELFISVMTVPFWLLDGLILTLKLAWYLSPITPIPRGRTPKFHTTSDVLELKATSGWPAVTPVAFSQVTPGGRTPVSRTLFMSLPGLVSCQ